MVVKMILERETKGAVRYQEVDDEGKVINSVDEAVFRTVYIRKSALGGKTPKAITIDLNL